MKITRDNYEQFFLDHVEGKLSSEMEKELTYFLEANPDLRPELEEYDPSPLQTSEIHHDQLKEKLKKHLAFTDHIKEDNIDEWMIRDIEGLLDEPEQNELAEFLLLNPAFSFDYKIFGHTKLSTDLSVTYRRKNELKKSVTHFPVSRLVWVLSAAAALLFLFIAIRYFNQPEIKIDRPVAPSIAALPPLSSPGIAAVDKISPQIKKQVLNTGTPSRVRVSANRIKPISTKQIIFMNPAQINSLNLARFDYKPIPATDKKERSLLGKVFSNLVAQANEGIGGRIKPEKPRKSDFSFWSIAKAGINGFNSMSDRELELYVRKDESGKVRSYALVEEERLILSKELNKN